MNEKKYDYLIVGSGLFGSVFAYKANQFGKKCLVIDKRNHLGGNLYCEEIEGISVHTYGAHIFHTNNKEVWNFVNSFTDFNRFTNSPLASFRGKLFNLPFNMNTFHQIWGISTPGDVLKKIEQQKLDAKESLEAHGIYNPRNLEEQALCLVGKDIYEILIKGYTEKQWGRACTDLPSFIIKRLPVRFVYDNNYFNDVYQGIPIGGYNKLINNLLKGIETRTSSDFFTNRRAWENLATKIVYTGKIDEFYDYKYGKLEYRSLRFENEICQTPNYQGNAVINFTDRCVPYTRIIEHKHFESFGTDVYIKPTTVITREYPAEYLEGMEPFYPINDKKNNLLYNKYKLLADAEENVIFGGRLAEYSYYDMAPIIENVLNYFKFNFDGK